MDSQFFILHVILISFYLIALIAYKLYTYKIRRIFRTYFIGEGDLEYNFAKNAISKQCILSSNDNIEYQSLRWGGHGPLSPSTPV